MYRGKRNLSPKERLEILFLEVNESRVCSKRPLCVEENLSFVVNRSVLKDKKDWLITDNGSFRNLGNSSKVFGIENGKVSITSLSFRLQNSTIFVNVCLCLFILFSYTIFFEFIFVKFNLRELFRTSLLSLGTFSSLSFGFFIVHYNGVVNGFNYT